MSDKRTDPRTDPLADPLREFAPCGPLAAYPTDPLREFAPCGPLTSARNEFYVHVDLHGGIERVRAARVSVAFPERRYAVLPEGYTEDGFCAFLKALDFYYRPGEAGVPQLMGTIWYKDGAWSQHEGAEYFAAPAYPDERWAYYEAPPLHDDCMKTHAGTASGVPA
jgi:hypothetical protein